MNINSQEEDFFNGLDPQVISTLEEEYGTEYDTYYYDSYDDNYGARSKTKPKKNKKKYSDYSDGRTTNASDYSQSDYVTRNTKPTINPILEIDTEHKHLVTLRNVHKVYRVPHGPPVHAVRGISWSSWKPDYGTDKSGINLIRNNNNSENSA